MCGPFIIVKASFVFYFILRDLWPGGCQEAVGAAAPSV